MRLLLVEDEKKVLSFIKKGLEEEGMLLTPLQTGKPVWSWVWMVLMI